MFLAMLGLSRRLVGTPWAVLNHPSIFCATWVSARPEEEGVGPAFQAEADSLYKRSSGLVSIRPVSSRMRQASSVKGAKGPVGV